MSGAANKLVGGALVGMAVGLTAACASIPEPVSQRPSLLSAVAATPAYVSPAEWRYFPPREAPVQARLVLDSGEILYAGDRGERWLVDPKKKRATPATALAPESLLAVTRLETGALLFVGGSGSSYEADTPLGVFTRSSAPLDPLNKVTAFGSTIAGIRSDGALLRSATAGATWDRVGDKRTRFTDVILASDGSGLALSAPEQLWTTPDGGATWQQLKATPSGVTGLHNDAKAGIVTRATFGMAKWEGGAKFSDFKGSLSGAKFQLKASPPRGPDAGSIIAHRAALIRDRYFELAKTGFTGKGWEMLHGRLGSGLRIRKLDIDEKCNDVKLAGFGPIMYVACLGSMSGRGDDIKLFRTGNAGKSWVEDNIEIRARWANFKFAVGAKGALIATGVCRKRGATTMCRPEGVAYRGVPIVDEDEDEDEDDKKSDDKKSDDKKDEEEAKEFDFALNLAKTPSMRGAAEVVGFSADGQTAFAVARRAKNSALTVYASRDGGKAYDAHEIDELSSTTPPSYSYSSRTRTLAGGVRTLAAAEDGTLALVARVNNRDRLIVVDDEGRMISLASAPLAGANIAAVGSRALATLGDRAWESLDGGSSWEEIGRLPIDPCRVAVKSCVRQGVCNSAGCVVGSAVVRVGWRGQADRLDAQRKPVSSDQGAFTDSVLQTPMTCTPSDDGWVAVKGLTNLPAADDIAIGDTAWYGVDFDTVKAQATLYRAKNVRKPKVDKTELLSKVARPTEYAFYGAKQIEGAAVVRYPIGTMKAGAKRYKNVEVTWANLFENGVVRQRIADAGELIAGDYISRGTKLAASALPNLVSVTPGGLYLRLHRHRRDRQVTHFLDGARVNKIPEVAWPSSVRGWRREMAHVGSTHVPLVFHPNGSQVVRAERDGDAWTFTARGVGINRPDRFGLRQQFDMVYAGGKSALHVYQFHRLRNEGTGFVFPFRATGAATDDPIVVPMQSDLPERPSRCTKSQIKKTPRLVVPMHAGVRHPLIVSDKGEPPRAFLTLDAVMHGTIQAPCVAGYFARVVKTELDPDAGDEVAVVLMNRQDKAWQFRRATGGIEYRHMECRWDERAEVPFELYGQPGVTVRR